MQINGNLQFSVLGSGSLNNAIIERVTPASGGAAALTTLLPNGGGTTGAAAAGRIVYNTVDTYYYYWNGTVWQSFASGTTSVSTFSGGSTGLTPSTATSGAVVLAGTLVAANGGTGQNSYTVGDILYASSTTALSKLGIGGAHTVLHGGTTPSYSAVDLTADVSNILPGTNGGTGVNNGTNLLTFGGNVTFSGAGPTTIVTPSGGANVTLPASGTLLSSADASGNYVSTFSAGSTGLTPSTASTGAVTLAGTLNLASGGTGSSLTGVAGGVVYSTSSGFGITSAGTAGQFVLSGGASAPTFLTNSTTINSDASSSSTFVVGTAFNVLGTTHQVTATGSGSTITLSLPTTLIAPGTVQTIGSLTVGGLTYESAATNIVATGTTQGTATALTASYNVVTTSTASSAPFNGVELPASGIGLEITVVNASTHSIYVYPAGTDVIDGEDTGSGASLGVLLPAGGTATYQSVNPGNWYTIDPVITVTGSGLGLAYSPGTTTLSNTGVTSFSTGTTGLSVASGTGAVTLAGTLSVASGGTGDTTFTTNGVLYGNGTGAIQATAAGANGYVLTSVSGVPTWASVSSLGVTSVLGTNQQIDVSTTAGVATVSLDSNLMFPGNVTVTGSNSLTIGSSATLNINGSLDLSGSSGAFHSVLASTAGGTPVWLAVVNSAVAGTGISVSGATGNVTIANTGVLSFDVTTSSTGLIVTPTTATTGAVAATVDLSASLQALATLGAASGTGLIVQTGVGTFADTTILGTAGNIVVTNGSGVAGSPTINLASVTQGSSGSFLKFTLDGFGRVVDNTAVTQGDLTGLLGTYYLPEAGGTMSGAINMGSNQINNLAMASSPAGTDATNVNYVQSLVNGLEWKAAVTAATSAADGNINLSTAPATIDGVTLTSGQRVLVKNQTTQTQNGIYVFNGAGNAMTRSTDANTTALLNNATVFVTDGTVNSDTGWTQTTPEPTIGTSNIIFAQFTGSGTYTAGTGLTLVGNTFSITNVGTAGTYGSASSVPVFTTNAQGQVTAVTPTSIAISGAAITSGVVGVGFGGTGTTTAPTTGQVLVGTSGGVYAPATIGTGTGISVTAGSGSLTINNTGVTSVVAGTGISVSGATGAVTINNTGVTSVALSTPGVIFSVSGSPVTTTGTLTLNLLTQTANTVFAGPASGSAATPTFRALVAADVAAIAVNSFSGGSTGLTPSSATEGVVTLGGVLNLASGGTNANLTAVAGGIVYGTASAMAFSAAGTTGQVLTSNAAGAPTWSSLSSLGVTSVAGTSNEILVNGATAAATGAVTLTLPTTVILPGSLEVTTTSKFDGLMYETTASVTASGSNPALTAAYNIVTSTGSGQGVTLPVPAYPGAEISIVNIGSNGISVFPNTGGNIDTAATNAAITIPAGGTWTGQASTTTQWYSIDPVVVNSTGISVTYSPGQTTIANTGVLALNTGTTGLLANGVANTNESGNVTLSGVLNPANGGTGVANNNASTLTISGAFGTTLTVTGTTNVTLPTSGTILSTANIAGNAVTTFQTSLTGLTPTTATDGAVTLAGTLGVASGGTGATSFTSDGILYGNGTGAVQVTAAGSQYQSLQAGSGGVPTFGAVALNQSAAVTGTLPVGNGGTGLTTVGTAGTVVASTGTANAYTPIQYIFSSAVADGGTGPNTSFTVSHGLNQRFVNVTVYDSTFNQIIPQSVVLTDANTVTVTVNSAIDLFVVVMGIAGVAKN